MTLLYTNSVVANSISVCWHTHFVREGGGLVFCNIPSFFVMLSIARENNIIFNDEYLKYQDVIDSIQQRLQKHIELLGYDSDDLKDALDYVNDRGEFSTKYLMFDCFLSHFV